MTLEQRIQRMQDCIAQIDEPLQRTMDGEVYCKFCRAEKTFSYVRGDRTPHTEDCEWRLAKEAKGQRWENVL